MYFDANIPCLQATVCRALLIFKTTTSKFRGSAGPRSTFEQNLKDAAQKNMALKIRGPISSLSVSLKLDILQYPGFQRHFRPFICCYIARFHCGLGLLEHDQLSVSLA
ncbi:conserved hypothetical protein [Trichinella spiralis]|uniref:hypothetical protein n=1 Tax=Trichinella spiralis TaxID=6334 RepID=UPI0001EFCD47|nr:conserved hypothetical protein [Trichinella spiralis]